MQQLVLNAGRMGKVNRPPRRHSRIALRPSREWAQKKSPVKTDKKPEQDTGNLMLGYLKLGLAYLALAS